MYTSSIVAVFTSILAVASASPTARAIKSRTTPTVVDVLLQFTALSDDNAQVSAIQVTFGEPKECFGNDGQNPCLVSMVGLSPFGANTNLENVECQGFSDAAGKVPIEGITTLAHPLIYSENATLVAVGSVVCSFINNVKRCN